MERKVNTSSGLIFSDGRHSSQSMTTDVARRIKMRERNKIFLIIAVLIIGAAITITRLYGQGKEDLTTFQQEEATPIKEGVMTEKQRVHSRLNQRRAIHRRERDC
jgi:hypothetical protein